MARIPYKSGLKIDGELQLNKVAGTDSTDKILSLDANGVVQYTTGITKNISLDLVTSAGNATGNDVILSGSSFISNLYLPLPSGGFGEIFFGEPSSTGYTAPTILNLDDLQDVSVLTPLAGQALVYDGSIWKNQTVATGEGFVTYNPDDLNVNVDYQGFPSLNITEKTFGTINKLGFSAEEDIIYWQHDFEGSGNLQSRFIYHSGHIDEIKSDLGLSNYLTGVTWGMIAGKPILFDGDYNSLNNKPDLNQYTLIDGSNAFGYWSINIYGTADYSYISDFAAEASYAYNADVANSAGYAETSIYWGNISSEIISSTGNTINRLLGVNAEGYAQQFQVSTLKSWLGLGSAAFKNESGTWNINISGNANSAYIADESNYSAFATLAGAAMAWGNREANFDEAVSDLTFLAGRGSDEVIKNVSKEYLKTWLGLGYWAYENAIGGNEIITSVGYEPNDIGVAKYLRWSNYGSNHVVFDGSKGVAPNGAAIDPNNSQQAWISTYPTLMGWNGAYTYGVRVDNARVADSAWQWLEYDSSVAGNSLIYMMGYNSVANKWTYYNEGHLKNWLGLGSAAYNDKSKLWAKSGDGNADHYYIQHYWDGTGWNLEAQNNVSDEQPNIHLVNINGYARSETLQSITDRGNTTSNNLTVQASEGRVVSTFLPTSYTTSDIVAGHRYQWYGDSWFIGNSRAGGATSEGFDIKFNSNASFLRILSNGNVGIGTTAPGYKLDVIGTAKATNVIATDSLAIPIGPPSSMEAGKAYIYIGT